MGIFKKSVISLSIATAVLAVGMPLHQTNASVGSETSMGIKGIGSFFRRHPRIRKAAKAAAVGATLGTGVGLVTGGSIAGSAAGGAARSATVSTVRTSKAWKKTKSKIASKHSDSRKANKSEESKNIE